MADSYFEQDSIPIYFFCYHCCCWCCYQGGCTTWYSWLRWLLDMKENRFKSIILIWNLIITECLILKFKGHRIYYTEIFDFLVVQFEKLYFQYIFGLGFSNSDRKFMGLIFKYYIQVAARSCWFHSGSIAFPLRPLCSGLNLSVC